MFRVAVCLFGEPRTFRYAVPRIRRTFETGSVEVDYFIHSWNRDGEGTGLPRIRKEYDEKGLIRNLSNICKGHLGAIMVESSDPYIKVAAEVGYSNLFHGQEQALRLFFLKKEKDYDIVVLTRLDSARVGYNRGSYEEYTVNWEEVIPTMQGRVVGVPDRSWIVDGQHHIVCDQCLVFPQETAIEYGMTIVSWMKLKAASYKLRLEEVEELTGWAELDLRRFFTERRIEMREVDVIGQMIRSECIDELEELLGRYPTDLEIVKCLEGFEEFYNGIGVPLVETFGSQASYNDNLRGAVQEHLQSKLRI